MAGTHADMVIYPEQYYEGKYEQYAQVTESFNDASNGAVVLENTFKKGDHENESFFKELANLDQDRDPSGDNDVTPLKLEQGEHTGVKIYRRIGPVENSESSFRAIASDPSEMSFILGSMAGKAMAVTQINTAISAAVTAIGEEPSLALNAASADHIALNASLRPFGDNSSRIVAFLMHSHTHFDLIDTAITDKRFEESGVVVYGGAPGTLNRPVIVTDSPALEGPEVGDGNDYFFLSLANRAITVNETEEGALLLDRIGGKDNIVMQYQAEYAFNLALKGYSFNKAVAAPNAAAIANVANWAKVATDDRMTAGTRTLVAA